ncbi:UDP-N-acetylmuramoyl-tripeptide--D-alanyl-D-alanine ligase [Oscillatoriales cyanobacterium LEGE 11467]|uniref:UDP-N-acetylmuramoyl-tripeptide--D-alanyl-D-alanine ligase n=1 Tax=Zarconia navalis LEGE 11467 TaxID=1828826 RepID=A0A928W002_9CYAN|nr:UDP-N-acetylmuramoyl-tripeptide--D-alanyl-D-alanine ligase [Zarconia navalis]MBE9041431.1 UDP-N-acetylmuramoyl-tripeptide--D-alanyl-D-alanine ligase [Zarconia navalis LEGE 11467]
MQIELAQLAEILGVPSPERIPPNPDRICSGITTDSRSIEPGNLFVALRGEKFDGHEFVATAAENGATAAIVDRIVDVAIPQFQVGDTLKAYQTLGRWWRDRFSIPIIGITGSVGKTTTKELIAAVLGTQGNVLATQANYNNEIGVPKTLFGLTPACDFAVIEMAMRGPGQIAELTHIARPDIAVITNVGTAHIGLLGSREAIARAKCELLAEMPDTGIAILNHDDRRLMATAATVWQGKTITYGLEGGDIRGELLDGDRLRVDGIEYPLPLSGEHNALNYLAAIAVATALDFDLSPLEAGLSVSLPDGRAKRYQLANDIEILDETYNAGLESMLAALKMLDRTPGTRHIAVLGTMKELGEKSIEFHRQVGEMAQKLALDALFILADPPEAEAMAAGAKGVAIVEWEDATSANAHETLTTRLQNFIQPGDRLLFKASHSVALDRVVGFLNNPS